MEASLTVRQEHGQDTFLAEIETADRNCSGLRDPAIQPREVLEIGVKLLTSHYNSHLMRLIDVVSDTLLMRCCQKVAVVVADRPKLARAIEMIFEEEVQKYCRETKMMVNTLIECQYEFVNLEHPRYKMNAQRDLGVYVRHPGTRGWFVNRIEQDKQLEYDIV